MQGLVLYCSKYGTSKAYAELIGEATGFAVCAAANARTVQSADAVILCGGVYAGKIAGLRLLKKNAAKLQGKKVAVFAAGLSPADERTTAALKRNLTGGLAGIPLFYGRGAWKSGSLKSGDRFLCRLLHGMLAKKDASQYEEPWMQTFMESSGKDCHFTDRQYLLPLLEWLRS